MILQPVSKFRVFAPQLARPMQIVYAGFVEFTVSPEHSESRVVIPSLEELLLVLLPEHSESRTFAEAGETLLVLLPEHSESRTLVVAGETMLVLLPEHMESMGLIISGMVSVNLDVTAELSFSLGILADLVFSLVPEAVSMRIHYQPFNEYTAILYRDSVTATLMPTHPRIADLYRSDAAIC